VRLIPDIIFTRLNSMPSNDLHGSSVLGIEVYGRRIFVHDEYIGGANVRIALLVAEGGQRLLLNDSMHT
jgi:hypothetical protein